MDLPRDNRQIIGSAGSRNINDGVIEPALITYLGLGATLYVPAIREDLSAILRRQKYPALRSVVFCTEDAIHDHQVSQALSNVQRLLTHVAERRILIFIRPRNGDVLRQLLTMPGIDEIDGFVLPKITPEKLLEYAEILAPLPHLWLMPTLETAIAFDRQALTELRGILEQLNNPVLCLRIGGNDLLNLLAIKRPKHLTLYDTPLRQVINEAMLIFRPAGYEIAAPVLEHFDNMVLLEQELKLDIAHGLLAKTAIHPDQVPVIQRAYQVNQEDLWVAEQILNPQAPAVFQWQGQMCEPATQRRWAERLLLQAELYGLS